MSEHHERQPPQPSRSTRSRPTSPRRATRLAGTVDELHTRTAPQEIARRQVESAKDEVHRGHPHRVG